MLCVCVLAAERSVRNYEVHKI